MKPNKFHSKHVCFAGRKTRKERKLCLKIRLLGFSQWLETGRHDNGRSQGRFLFNSDGPFKIWARAQIRQPLTLALKFKPVLWVVSHVTKRLWLLRKREGMRDRKLVGSRQRSLSSRFSLSRRERPLLAGMISADDLLQTCYQCMLAQ